MSLPARRLIGMLKQVPQGGSDDFQQARGLLEDWDQIVDRDSQAAPLYEIWQEETLVPRFVEAELPPDARDLVARNIKLPTLFDLLERAPSGQRNSVITESLEKAFARTQQVLGNDVASWRWGSIHRATFAHPLANTEARAAVLDRGPVERGGDAYTPNRSPGPNYTQVHGASYRHILDFDDWDRSVFTSVPGQSESPHYSDLVDLWGNYEYAPLVYSREAVEANTANKLMLEPAP